MAEAVEHASIVDLDGGVRLRVATVADLIVLKLAAAAEPTRRPSKREHDVADVLALIEEHPEVKSAALVARVQRVRTQLLTAGLDVSVDTPGDEE
jgi:predicted nucleotidyltransferase